MQRALFLLLLVVFAVPALARTWTDSTGKYTTEATLVDLQGDVAYLKKSNGAIAAVPLARLSATDQEYIKDKVLPVNKLIGRVVALADGDTLSVLEEGKTVHKVRLEGIDSPEKGQAFASQAKMALADKVFQKDVRVEWRQKDRYGRILGHVFLDGRWINKELVEEGWAWHFKKYSKSEVLARAERKARKASVGLWQDFDAVAPWEYRNPPVATALAMQSLTPTPAKTDQVQQKEVTVYGTRTGSKYHLSSCRHLRQSRIPMSLSDAAARYSPCKVCNPPVPNESQARKESPKYTPQARSTSPPAYTPPSNSSSSGGDRVYVKGYYRKDGTYVRPHTRRRPRR